MRGVLIGALTGILLSAAWFPDAAGYWFAKAHKAYIAEMMR